jgi:hypothetical protein
MSEKIGAVGALAGAALLLAPAPAAAEPVYFHKANVERAVFEADLAECVELAGGVQPPTTPAVYSPNLYAVAATAFLAGFMNARQRRRMAGNVLRTCMADKEYRRVEATEATAKELKKLGEKERAERLFTLSSAPEPEGTVLPQ